jgi:hypothetical protein
VRNTHSLIFFFLLFTVTLVSSHLAADNDVYRWTDADGVVHFGDNPPQGLATEQVEIDQPPPAQDDFSESDENEFPAPDGTEPARQANPEPEVSYAQQRRDEREIKRKQLMSENAEKEINCARMEQQRATLEPMTRVIVTDENGEARRLDDDERLEGLEEAKSYLTENCGQD